MMTQKSPKKRNEAKRVNTTQRRKRGFINDFRGPPALRRCLSVYQFYNPLLGGSGIFSDSISC